MGGAVEAEMERRSRMLKDKVGEIRHKLAVEMF